MFSSSNHLNFTLIHVSLSLAQLVEASALAACMYAQRTVVRLFDSNLPVLAADDMTVQINFMQIFRVSEIGIN